MRPGRFFLLAGLLCGLAFVFITPPFQVPDEPAHFYRAYAVSEGNLAASRGEGGLGAVLPASLQELGEDLRGDLPFHPERAIRAERVFRALRVPLEPRRRRFTDYRTAALVTPVSYLPQAAGIAIARGLGAPALGLLYAARLANLLAATALIALGLRRLPSYPWLLAMLALTPMALFLRGSASADALNTAAAFLLAGTAARLAWGAGEQVRWTDVAVLTAGSAALCLSKPVYFPLAFVVLLIPAARFPGGRRGRILLIYAAITAAALTLALKTAGSTDISIRPDAAVDADRQIADALADPLRVGRIFLEDYLHRGRRYVAQIVGQLGWLDANLPKPLLWGYAALLGLLALFDTRRTVEVSPGQRLLLILVALATLALVSASQYALWTPYGADFVDGIQGRYFLPLAPAAAWILHTRRFQVDHLDRLLDQTLPWLSLLAFGAALWTVLSRYYLSS
ncbi:MAG: DUF2142 domain-containing protein [Thermoanaerobaculia bacterium]